MYDFKTALTPKREDGGLDQRYSQAVQSVINTAGSDVITGLDSMRSASSAVEREHAGYAIRLVEAVATAPMDPTQRKYVRKTLKPLLEEIGFKPSNVSKILGSTTFVAQLQANGSDATDWVKSLPISSQYELSRMSDSGFSQAWVNASKWGQEDVSVKELAKLRQKYPAVDTNRGKYDRSSKPSLPQQTQPTEPNASEETPFEPPVYEAKSETISKEIVSAGEPSQTYTQSYDSLSSATAESSLMSLAAAEDGLVTDPAKLAVMQFLQALRDFDIDEFKSNPELHLLFDFKDLTKMADIRTAYSSRSRAY